MSTTIKTYRLVNVSSDDNVSICEDERGQRQKLHLKISNTFIVFVHFNSVTGRETFPDSYSSIVYYLYYYFFVISNIIIIDYWA